MGSAPVPYEIRLLEGRGTLVLSPGASSCSLSPCPPGGGGDWTGFRFSSGSALPRFPSLFEKDVSSPLLLLRAVSHTRGRLHPSGHGLSSQTEVCREPRGPRTPSPLLHLTRSLNMIQRRAGKRGALFGRPRERRSSQDRLEGAEMETGNQR